jgi:uncharacterized protein
VTAASPVPPPLPAPAPVDADRRLQALDALRGFALLGIFLMNIEWFTRPPQHMGSGIDPAATGPDHVAAMAVYVLVQGKFWVLFSLLFGMGFALMSGRAVSGPAFRRVYLRRCLALLGFGLAHGLLLWSGDILHAYALGGLLLLALDGIPRRAWPWLGAGLYIMVAGMLVLYGLVLGLLPLEAQQAFARMAADTDRAAAAAAAALGGGSWPAAVAGNAHAFATITLPGLVVLLPMVLGVFMLGAWLYGTGRFADVAAHCGWFARLAAWTLPTGAALTAASLAVGTHFDGMREAGPMTLASALLMLASLPLALGYLALFALALGTRALARPLLWLAPAGRMALTHYLLQSLVAALLFHGWGFGLWGQVGRAGQVAIVVAVFALQVLASHWWLARYRFGPMEWLWRRISYGAPPPMRRA